MKVQYSTVQVIIIIIIVSITTIITTCYYYYCVLLWLCWLWLLLLIATEIINEAEFCCTSNPEIDIIMILDDVLVRRRIRIFGKFREMLCDRIFEKFLKQKESNKFKFFFFVYSVGCLCVWNKFINCMSRKGCFGWFGWVVVVQKKKKKK